MANGAIVAALRGFAADAEKRDANVRLSQKARERSQVRYLRTSDALQLQRIKFEEELERTMRRAAFVFCRLSRYCSGKYRTRCGAPPHSA